MSKKSIVEKLEEFNDVSSWLLWDEEFKHDEAAKKYVFKDTDINTEYVFVALNASYKPNKSVDSWGSFHSGSQGDKNLKEAFKGSSYQGCYITDILKYKDVKKKTIYKNSKSENAIDYIRNNPSVFNANVRILEDEIRALGKDVTIIAFGRDVYNMLKYNPTINNLNVIRIPHFSPLVCNNGRDYKLAVDNVLKQCRMPRLLDEMH